MSYTVARADGEFEIIEWPKRLKPRPDKYTEAECRLMGFSLDDRNYIHNFDGLDRVPWRRVTAAAAAKLLSRDDAAAYLYRMGYIKPERVEHNPYCDLPHLEQESTLKTWTLNDLIQLSRARQRNGIKPVHDGYLTDGIPDEIFYADRANLVYRERGV